ncbi:MAG: hypothetical protein ACLSHG_09000 [Oscillospiraceae bacterium]
MKTLLRPYEGTLPYLFVSYAHKNDAASARDHQHLAVARLSRLVR